MKSLFAYRRSATTESALSERFHGGVVFKCKLLSKYESSSVMGQAILFGISSPAPSSAFRAFWPQSGMGNVMPNRKIQGQPGREEPEGDCPSGLRKCRPRLSLRSGNGSRNFTILSFARKQMTADVSLVM